MTAACRALSSRAIGSFEALEEDEDACDAVYGGLGGSASFGCGAGVRAGVVGGGGSAEGGDVDPHLLDEGFEVGEAGLGLG